MKKIVLFALFLCGCVNAAGTWNPGTKIPALQVLGGPASGANAGVNPISLTPGYLGTSIAWKQAVELTINTNQSVAAAAATYDGVAPLVSGTSRILLTGQTAPAENGLWIWNGAAAALTRPADYVTGSTTLAFYGARTAVLNGNTLGGTEWYITTTGTLTIGTTGVAWTQFITTSRLRAVNGTAMGQPSGTPGTAGGAAGNVNGTVRYAYYEVDPSGSGKTTLSAFSQIAAVNQHVTVTIPLPSRGSGGRVLCRTKNGDTATYYILQNIGGDFYTTFDDNVLDASLGSVVTNTDTTTLYRFDTPQTGVINLRGKPTDSGPADLTLLTGKPGVASDWALDSYGTIVARSTAGGSINAFYARCYGAGASNSALQVDSIAAAYGSAAGTVYSIFGDGHTAASGAGAYSTWTNGTVGFQILPVDGDAIYLKGTTNNPMYLSTNNTARLGITGDGTEIYPIATNTTALGDSAHVYNGLFSVDANLTSQSLTAGTMTYATNAAVKKTLHRFTWTNAQVVALGAVTAGDISVCTLPAKTIVTNAYVVINTPDSSANALTVATGRVSAAYIDYIVASDAKAAANTVYGDAVGERGANLTGYDLPSFTGTTVVNAHFIKTTTNLNTVTGSTGTVYLETMTVP